jgi:hypothetical protein
VSFFPPLIPSPSNSSAKATLAMGLNDFRNLRQAAKRERVFPISSKYHPDCNESRNVVPSEHRKIFASIQSIGRMTYKDYGPTSASELRDKPWQSSNKRMAEELVKRATKCKAACQSESAWRCEIEHRIMDRFSYEVAW